MDFGQIILKLSEGFLKSLSIFGLTLLFSLPLGLFISFMSMSKVKVIKYITAGFVWIIRGTPLMLQLIVIHYAPAFMGISTESFTSVIIGFSINYACYFSEIFRGGIISIGKGQHEACQVLGINKFQAFKFVILPQVVKRILPPMSNEFITLVKDTSLAKVILVQELMFVGQEIMSVESLIWPLLATGIFYLVFNGLLTILFAKAEKKLGYYR